jgi:hypothetical protein
MADLLSMFDPGDKVRVTWHYKVGVGAPTEPSTFTGTIIEHGPMSTHIRNDLDSNLYLPRNSAVLDVEQLTQG